MRVPHAREGRGGTGAVRDKYRKAHGGCLGSRRRRRARQAAKSRGEARTAYDPRMPEWGNPAVRRTAILRCRRRTR